MIIKAKIENILIAAYNSSRAQGMGIMRFTPEPLTHEKAASIISNYHFNGVAYYFDYINGRAIKLQVKPVGVDEFDVSINTRNSELFWFDHTAEDIMRFFAEIRNNEDKRCLLSLQQVI